MPATAPLGPARYSSLALSMASSLERTASTSACTARERALPGRADGKPDADGSELHSWGALPSSESGPAAPAPALPTLKPLP